MSEKKIQIKIDPLGNPTISTEGFSGTACKDATKNIENVFAGGAGVHTEYKPEWHESGETAQAQEQTW